MKLPEITLDWLKKKGACFDGYKYCAEVKITDPIALIQRLIDDDHNDWADWLIVQIMDHKQKIAYAIYAAELVLPIFEKKYPSDLRPRMAIKAARKCLGCDIRKNKIDYAVAAVYAAAAEAVADCAANAGSNDSCSAASAAYTAVRAARAVTSVASATYAANAAFDAAGAYARECREEAYSKILAHGIELLVKAKQ